MSEGLTPEISKEETDKIEDREVEAAEIIEAIQQGGKYYVRGTLVRDDEGKLAQVVDYTLVEDASDATKILSEEDDSSVRQPARYTNPEVKIQYADSRIKIIKALKKIPAPVCNSVEISVREGEEFYELSHFEFRGHDYKLGEMVSFGARKMGRLALIVLGEKPKFGIIARETFGGQGPFHFWMVDVESVDEVVYEDGAVKRHPDRRIFRPYFDSNANPTG